jgi:hypothetical protein
LLALDQLRKLVLRIDIKYQNTFQIIQKYSVKKMFCPVCGTILEANARFCPECGAKIFGGTPTPYEKTNKITQIAQPPTSQPSRNSTTSYPERQHKHPQRRRRGITVGLFIGILLLAGGGIFGIVMAANWGTVEGYNYYVMDDPTPASIETMVFNIDIADVVLKYNDSSTDHLVMIEYHYKASGGFLDGKSFEDLYTVTWENSTNPVFISDFQWFGNWVFVDRSKITITLRSDVVWAIDGDITTGKLDFNVPEETTFSNFSLGATTGDIDLTIQNGTVFQENFAVAITTGSINILAHDVVFQKDFSAIATTGDIDLDGSGYQFKGDFYADITTGSINITLEDAEFGENVELYSTTGDIYIHLTNPIYNSNESNWIGDITTGSFELIILQNNPMTTNVTGTITSTTGDIDIQVTLDTSIGARFFSTVSTGDYDYQNDGGFEILGGLFQTTTYPLSSNYNFVLHVSTGSIFVEGLTQ